MVINDIPQIMLYCLGLTIFIECSIALVWGVYKPADLVIVFLVNILTNPLLVSIGYLILFQFGETAYNIATAVMEIAVVFAEGLIYKKMLTAQKRPFLLSLSLNVGSFLLGLVLNYLIY